MTAKERMLNAYKGVAVDKTPIAPEFWYYYPAKVLGVSMVEFELEVPFWYALKTSFEKYNCEGWGITYPSIQNNNLKVSRSFKKINDTQYEENIINNYKGYDFTTITQYDKFEPSWLKKHLVTDGKHMEIAVDMMTDTDNVFDFSTAIEGYNGVGESYLLEMAVGNPFFDFIAHIMGYENAVMFFVDEDEDILKNYMDKYINYQKYLIRETVKHTHFESFMVGCSYSCNSLIGQNMWRKWDKPYLKAITDEIHKLGKLLHIHFHGRSIETIEDFAEIGIDCVCPFERPPGGDIVGINGLKYVREKLDNKVTFNGNVHTVETLIRGGVQDVIREVDEIKTAFSGSNRLIIGSGDQVGGETPEENIFAMIEEGRK